MLHHDRKDARAQRRAPSGEAAGNRRIRTRSIALAGVAGALLIGVPTVLVGVGTPAGAEVPAPVPTFPDNLNVFPNRDFVSVDGYSTYGGQQATITVTRPTIGIIGAATGEVSGGDVAFEVNHPGGICWGAGGGPNVTPDIQPGDVVSITIGGNVLGATTVQDVQAFDAVQVGKTVTVGGHIGPNVNPDNIEQRIIEPALRDTVVNKRDVRAVPGDLVGAGKGGYSSSLTIDQAKHTFVATYIFDDLESATIAANAGLGERAMAWEITDADANRQGMTIAENGEPGGPGMGGCPNGPLQSGPPGPTNVGEVRNGTSVDVSWTPASSVPGAPAIQGYRVTALAQSSSNNEQIELGKRIANPTATGTTINGLADGETYDIEVVSYSSTGDTFPAVHATNNVDSVPPVVTATPAGGSYAIAQQVTLKSNEPDTDIYYTTSGADPVDSTGVLDPDALPYSGAITISTATTLKFAGFDLAGNVSLVGREDYSITNYPAPAAPATVNATPGSESVSVDWSPADPGSPAFVITQYKVDVFNAADATTPVSSVNVNGDVTSTIISGLAGDSPYWIAVSARNNVNSVFGPSTKVGPVTPVSELRANAGNDQTNVTRNTVVKLSGAGSTGSGATFSWAQLPSGIVLPDPNAVTLTPVPGTNGRDVTFTLPFFKYPMTNQPLTFRLAVTVNGVTKTDDVVVVPHIDTINVTKTQWKVGDFRVSGTSNGAVGSTLTARTANGTVLATGTVAAGGTFDLRNRNNLGAAQQVFVESNMGGTVGPFNPTT